MKAQFVIVEKTGEKVKITKPTGNIDTAHNRFDQIADGVEDAEINDHGGKRIEEGWVWRERNLDGKDVYLVELPRNHKGK